MTLPDLAGLASTAFRAPPQTAAWKQVNVALVRDHGDARASARALFAAVMPVLDGWSRDGLLHGWFFMRKPPDVRLRVCLDAGGADAAPALDRALEATQAAGGIVRFFWSEYAAEEERFGGAAAMRLVHAYFHVDSALWFTLDALEQRSLRETSADLLLPAVFNDLFRRSCGEQHVREAWRELAALITEGGPFSFNFDGAAHLTALDALESVQDMHEAERTALRSYIASNAVLGERLNALPRESLGGRSPVQIAATVAFFNLNRHGFGGERSAPMTARVLAALDRAA